MNRCMSVLAVSVVLGAGVTEARESRQIEETQEIQKGQLLRIDLPVAELRVAATDRSDVGIDLTVTCRWRFRDCEGALEDVGIVTRSTSRRLTLELSGLRRWSGSLINVEGTIEVPRTSPLEVKMGVADLQIRDVELDLRVDLGVGELDLRLPEASFGEAFVDVGVGSVRFLGGAEPREDRRTFLVGNEVHWSEGSGQAELDVEVGVGEVTVHLR